MSKPDLPKITEQQRRFVDAYLIDPNGSKAAAAAGYSTKSGNHRVMATRLLANPKIRQHLLVAREQRSERVRVDSDWVLLQLAESATTDIIELFHDDGTLKPLSEMTERARRLIAGLEIETRSIEVGDEKRMQVSVAKIKLADRLAYIREIGRHIDVSAFRDNLAVHSADELGQRILAARARAQAYQQQGEDDELDPDEISPTLVLEMGDDGTAEA